MQCQTAQELFSDYIAQELDRAMTLSLEHHLSACPACRDEVAALRRTWQALDRMPRVDLPPYFHENLISRIVAEQARVEQEAAARRAAWDWRWLFRPRQLAFGAAALALVLASAEVIQTQRAALGPVGWVTSLFRHPSQQPHIRVEWAPENPADPARRGTLIVRWYAMPATPDSGLTYSVLTGPQDTSVSTGVLFQPDTDARIQLEQRPETVRIRVTGATTRFRREWSLTLPKASGP
ncbi:MAG: zf-HC2 domain-containing protein [Chloroherpetonaceae bacterium]|nr:zf-HC2 domain-containing protein [Chthonomonadaceae bacterium]MDW8207457.1 zf-HC2 domain-containing protein [Chloroherpetonaceae bacterium]